MIGVALGDIVKMNEKLKKLVIQFIKFGCVGVSNTLVSLAVYYIFLWLNWNLYLGNAIGFILGTLNAYIWNSKFVFKKGRCEKNSSVVIKTYLSYGFSLLVSEGLLFLWVEILSISDVIAPILNLCVTVPLNFLLNKLWVYGKGEGSAVKSNENGVYNHEKQNGGDVG